MFLLALAAGTSSALRLPLRKPGRDGPSGERAPGYRSTLARDWHDTTPFIRVALILMIAGMAMASLDLLLTRFFIYTPARTLVRAAYSDQAPPWINRLFDQVAEDASTAPVEAYIVRGDRLVNQGLAVVVFSLATAALALAAWKLPRTRSSLREEAKATSPRLWVRSSFLAWLVLAGVASGLAISIRSVGLFALLLVGLVYLGTQRARAILPLLTLALLAAVVAYVTWPFLWGNPIRALRESLAFLAGNPNKDYVLFMGEVTKGRLLPWFYLPFLTLIQFTEPVWLLFLAGLATLFRPQRTRLSSLLAVVLGLWLLAPTAPLILQHAWFYDNFRQFLFVTPAVFVLAALGLNALWEALGRLRRPALWWVLCGLLLAPGMVAIIRLHPYQYVYFNSFVHGTEGAFRQFELDYWVTSYSAAMKRLNALLPAGSVVAFRGTMAPALPYARPDLVLQSYSFETDASTISADVIVSTTRANVDLDLRRFTCRLENVEIDGAILASIRDPMPCD